MNKRTGAMRLISFNSVEIESQNVKIIGKRGKKYADIVDNSSSAYSSRVVVKSWRVLTPAESVSFWFSMKQFVSVLKNKDKIGT